MVLDRFIASEGIQHVGCGESYFGSRSNEEANGISNGRKVSTMHFRIYYI